MNYLSQPRKKQFEIPKYLELLVDKAIDLFNLSGISCVDMLQYMLEHDINNWVHYYAYTFIIPIAQGKSSECVKDLSDLYALVMTGYILDTLLKTSKTISVHFNGKTMDKLLMVVKQKFDEKENKSFWHIELETLPYRNRESKGKYCITTFLHGMYYPDEDIFTHIDYTKNQYDIDTYLNKYSDCNEDMPIDTYTSSNELHYKIWCIEGGKYSRETWYRLMVVSLNQEYVELLDEILE